MNELSGKTSKWQKVASLFLRLRVLAVKKTLEQRFLADYRRLDADLPAGRQVSAERNYNFFTHQFTSSPTRQLIMGVASALRASQ